MAITNRQKKIDQAKQALIDECRRLGLTAEDFPEFRKKIPKERLPAKTGRGGNANFPNSRAGLIQTDEDAALVAKLVAEAVDSYLQPKVKSDEELAQRFADYFNKVVSENRVPTLEDLYLYTGYGFTYINNIELGMLKGFSNNTKAIIKNARETMRVIDSKLVTSGKLNPIPYIFRAKNFYNMTDRTELQVNAAGSTEPELTADEIARRYLADNSAEEIAAEFSDLPAPEPEQ